MALLYIDGLEKIVDHYDTFIIDLWGVVHDGIQPYNTTKECLTKLQEHGKQVYFLSNSPRRSATVTAQLRRLGIDAHLYQGLHTSGEDAYEVIAGKFNPFYANLGIKVYPLSLQMHSQLFRDLNLDIVNEVKEASFILNTGPALSYPDEYDEILQEGFALSLPMICVNPDIAVISGGKVTLCAGTLAERYKALGGCVKYHGKPYPEIYQNLLKKMAKTDTDRILAIGDSMMTDIKGANHMKIDSALVLTGLSEQEFGPLEAGRRRLEQSSHHKEIYPTYVLPSLAF